MSTMTARQRGFGDDGALIAAFLGIGVLYWMFIAARAEDGMMAFHAYTFIAAFLAGLFALIVRATGSRITYTIRASGANSKIRCALSAIRAPLAPPEALGQSGIMPKTRKPRNTVWKP